MSKYNNMKSIPIDSLNEEKLKEKKEIKNKENHRKKWIRNFKSLIMIINYNNINFLNNLKMLTLKLTIMLYST